ncbi:zinc-dependent peptidase [Hymenobacter cheonanensis]|uniref:zinc-dependent peptidase n=1 Tax=Hymenobacter sp. CA2-7 TaxID=3063993 RepID=UPI0027129FFC|nr:zinc-dependent peptidase [Hymenobacter sp. CA2-7]MDO7886620.1 zinc-dependent peptidase [Hymenobacter sp. CA2-7]
MPLSYVLTGAVLLALLLVFYRYLTADARRRQAALATPFPAAWRTILTGNVAFYDGLADTDKGRFEQAMQLFLARTRLTGIQTEVDDLTRVLTAAAAVIPVFGFPGWEYPTLHEVLIVPDAWQLETRPDQEVHSLQGTLLGSVQRFQTSQYMRLSRAALVQGFADAEDKHNVGVHEFAHLVDEADGEIDGVPGAGLPPALRPAWAAAMQRELAAIRAGHSDIDPYAGTNEAEFFAVVNEYFFERPEKLKEHHPELFDLLAQALHQHPEQTLTAHGSHLDPRQWLRQLRAKKQVLGRNSPCPCGSGKKYKDCHLAQAA